MKRAAATLCAALGLAGTACRERTTGLDGGPPPPVGSAAPPPPAILYAGSIPDLVARARASVVAIRAATPVKSGPASMYPGAPDGAADVALGTGFLIESRGSVFVLTNDHIAGAVSELRIGLPGGVVVPARIVGRDVRLDVALLGLDDAPAAAPSEAGSAAPRVPLPPLLPLPLGTSADLQVGERLVVLGNPFGDEVSASAGIVSATGHDAAGSLVSGGFRTFLHTDARIHRGNSGGPVLDAAGQVVGIAVATGDRTGELSFAIPIDRVREALDALRDHGQVTRSWLGVIAHLVTPELARSLAMPQPAGAVVTEVVTASPAARAGLRKGDVILKWGDREVDQRSLPWIVASTPVGRTIAVTVWRNRAALQLPVVTERMRE